MNSKILCLFRPMFALMNVDSTSIITCLMILDFGRKKLIFVSVRSNILYDLSLSSLLN